MANFTRSAWNAIAVPVLLAAVANAAPVRVGTFTGNGQYLTHTGMNTATNAINSILAAPTESGLGPDLVISQEDILVTAYGCNTSNCRVSEAQANAFIQALDTLDVVVFVHYEADGDLSGTTFDSGQRAKIESFFHERGVVSIHATTFSNGAANWPKWASFHGARGHSHPVDQLGTIHLDSLSGSDAHWKFLNRGLPDTARFFEEWFSFSIDGDSIRNIPDLKVTTRIDESSYETGMGSARVMGDHPMSWYRTFSEGGRFFYTALGHRGQHYLGTGNATTPEAAYFLRRQLYNAILWAAKYNEDGSIPTRVSEQGVRGFSSPSRFADQARASLSGGVLTVSLLRDGGHAIAIRGLDGRLVATRRGTDARSHRFEGLNAGVHVLAVETPVGRAATLVTIP